VSDSKRWKPYVWVTWLTGLLAGMDHCEWRLWYRAHHRYAKREVAEGDLDQWKIDHDQMVRARVALLQATGYTVNVEDENAFKLKGSTIELGGKPDIVAVKGANHAIVIDEKSGQQKMADRWQVKVYMYVLPRVGFRIPLTGEVQYRATSVEIPPIDPKETAAIVSLMQMAGSSMVPPRTPSAQECAFCDVLHCPDRIEAKKTEATTTEF
jgi:CRISPR/Cas system-associated exonuclease Cas4 (RecB family)